MFWGNFGGSISRWLVGNDKKKMVVVYGGVGLNFSEISSSLD